MKHIYSLREKKLETIGVNQFIEFLHKLYMIHYCNENAVSQIKQLTDLNIYFGRLCHHQELQPTQFYFIRVRFDLSWLSYLMIESFVKIYILSRSIVLFVINHQVKPYTLQRVLDRTCVNLRSNRFTPTKRGFSAGRTEWRNGISGD
jgi:hypothetical protein